MVDLSKLREINSVQADKALSQERYDTTLQSTVQVANTILSATTSLIQYLEGHTSKVQVVNQLENIGTPDALEVIPHIEALHATLKARKETDLTEVTSLIKSLLEEAKQIPKELPVEKEQKFVDYTKDFDLLTKAIQTVEQAVKSQETTVQAPVVNVPAPIVNVDAPDLKPLEKGLGDVTKAIKAGDTRNKEGLVEVKQMNTLISEKFDEWKASYSNDPFSDEKHVSSIDYLFKGKKVASIKYSYKDGQLVGCKRV